jgi:hypothetical protein
MRVLCDQHVARKYRRAFEDEPRLTVATVRESVGPDAADETIAEFARRNDWVVFTNDSDFRYPTPSHGLLVYSQIEDPRPGAVVDTLLVVDEAYDSAGDIYETVPGGWA